VLNDKAFLVGTSDDCIMQRTQSILDVYHMGLADPDLEVHMCRIGGHNGHHEGCQDDSKTLVPQAVDKTYVQNRN